MQEFRYSATRLIFCVRLGGMAAVRILMGLLRYLVQGFGWEIGRTAAREGLDAARQHSEDAPPPTRRELRRAAKERREAEAERLREVERKTAEIEAELARLKKQK